MNIKELIIDQKILDIDFMDTMTVIYLENGHDIIFHEDTGDVEIKNLFTNSN
jgi:hypothetical protein